MQKLTLAAVSRNYFNLPVWIALDQGLFAAENLDVALELYEPIDEVTDRLRDGRAQLAVGVTEHVVLDSEAGGHLAIVGGNVNKLPFTLIGGREIRTMQDLRGKVIGVSSLDAGSSSLVIKMLASHGLAYPRDYALRAVGPILARWELLQSGEIDAGLQGAPLDYIAIDAGFVPLAAPRAEFPHFQFTSLNVDLRWASQNRDTMVGFLRAWVRAHVWFYANKDGATRIAMAETGVKARYAARAWDDYVGDEIFPRDGGASAEGVQSLIEVSALIRAIPNRAKTRPEEYIDRSYLDTALT